MSTHSVNVTKLETVLPHPNADRLEIIPIPGSAWQCVSQKGEFKPGDLAVYIEPDYMVPTDRPEFAFLKKDGDNNQHRLRAVKLRGVVSFGLLIPPPAWLTTPYESILAGGGPHMRLVREGDDVMDLLGIKRWVPQENVRTGAGNLQGPWPAGIPIFDVDSYSNHPGDLQEGDDVIITEKIHGTNARYLFKDGVFYMGSRTRWLDPNGSHIWGRAASVNANGELTELDSPIFAWCKAHPGAVLYGEIYGPVQSLKYGERVPRFAAFAAYDPPGVWMSTASLFASLRAYDVPRVPVVYSGEWSGALLLLAAEDDSTVLGVPKGHMREGIVIQKDFPAPAPGEERLLKHISTRYWTSRNA